MQVVLELTITNVIFQAVKRMIERNNLTEEQAQQRLNAQISNIERVEMSNVILCTLWEYEYTQQQVSPLFTTCTNYISDKQICPKTGLFSYLENCFTVKCQFPSEEFITQLEYDYSVLF
jgi:hypothetical protein